MYKKKKIDRQVRKVINNIINWFNIINNQSIDKNKMPRCHISILQQNE